VLRIALKLVFVALLIASLTVLLNDVFFGTVIVFHDFDIRQLEGLSCDEQADYVSEHSTQLRGIPLLTHLFLEDGLFRYVADRATSLALLFAIILLACTWATLWCRRTATRPSLDDSGDDAV
jgi:hypothetical protein